MIRARVRVFYRSFIDMPRAPSHVGWHDSKQVSESLAIKSRKRLSNEAARLGLLTRRSDMRLEVKGNALGRKSSPIQYLLGRFCGESPIALLPLSGHTFRGRKLTRSQQRAGVADRINTESVFKS